MALPIFYQKPVALSSQTHAGLRLRARGDFRFAGTSNSVMLAATEFAQACHEYPIVFVREAENVFPVAVLGLKDKQNLFVTEKGRWEAAYIPAYVRRYPFILARQDEKSSQFTVCIDESYAGFNREEGEPLFRENGEQSDFLKRALTLVQEYQAHCERSGEFTRRLDEWGLLQPLQANVQLNSGARMSLTGFMTVNQDKLKTLAAERITELMEKDEMGLIYYHLLSLNNFARLVDRVAEAA